MNWLLLMHQIPAKPSSFRARVWRRLQKAGAVAIKQAVYAMPESESSREDLGWIAKEIMESGGEAIIVQAMFLEGLNDDHVVELFSAARREDYLKIMQEARLLADQFEGRNADEDSIVAGRKDLSRLRKALAGVKEIDFFPGPELAQTEGVLGEADEAFHGPPEAVSQGQEVFSDLKGKVWVTRAGLYVDRMACAWFIRRFIDQSAQFLFVSGAHHSPQDGEIRFDMMEAEFTHKNDLCTFEVLTRTFAGHDSALRKVAKVIHDIDLKEDVYGLAETSGIKAMFDGIVSLDDDDNLRVERATGLLDGLYAHFKAKNLEKRPRH